MTSFLAVVTRQSRRKRKREATQNIRRAIRRDTKRKMWYANRKGPDVPVETRRQAHDRKRLQRERRQ